MEHIADSDFSDPFIPPGTESASSFTPNPEALPLIMGMGFTREHAVKALKATDNNVERAVDWIFSHQDELNDPASPTGAPQPPEIRDGDGSKTFNVIFVFQNYITRCFLCRIQADRVHLAHGHVHHGRALRGAHPEGGPLGHLQR